MTTTEQTTTSAAIDGNTIVLRSRHRWDKKMKGKGKNMARCIFCGAIKVFRPYPLGLGYVSAAGVHVDKAPPCSPIA